MFAGTQSDVLVIALGVACVANADDMLVINACAAHTVAAIIIAVGKGIVCAVAHLNELIHVVVAVICRLILNRLFDKIAKRVIGMTAKRIQSS